MSKRYKTGREWIEEEIGWIEGLSHTDRLEIVEATDKLRHHLLNTIDGVGPAHHPGYTCVNDVRIDGDKNWTVWGAMALEIDRLRAENNTLRDRLDDLAYQLLQEAFDYARERDEHRDD